ncbi:MAG TPA: hypothetical protein VGJ26_04245 [Pirellulales bacterium]|jgi:hypothetical protein
MIEPHARQQLQQIDAAIATASNRLRELEGRRAALLARLTDANGCEDRRPLANVAEGG